MKATHGSQKRTWIAPTSQLSFYSHGKQHMRQRSQREASAKLTLILKLRERRTNGRRKKSQKRQGFAWGLELEYIIRAAESSGELMFDEADLVPAKEAAV